MLFAFDLERNAILLVGGDKSADWAGWYSRNIPIADARFDEHQASLAAGRAAAQGSGNKTPGGLKSRRRT